MTRLNGHERHEFNALLDDANALDAPTRARGVEVLRLLDDAIQAQQPWAQIVIDGWMLSGAMNAAKRRHKQTSVAKVKLTNAERVRPMVVGTKRVDPSGALVDQQELVLELPWAAVEDRVKSSARRVRDLGFTVATDRKVLALRARCPESSTPAEACRLLGIDFFEYMAAAS